ncbi:MAG TPA: pilus assembly protein [Chloroflexi bacterium]|nr:pilus assembly protein [Chloroflexota bacterium]
MQQPGRRLNRQGRALRAGQTLVEFALVFLLLFTVVMGIIEFGHLITVYAATITASREAARYGDAIGPGADDANVPRYQDCTGITATALRIGRLANMTAADVTITYDHGPGTTVFATCPPASVALGDRIIVSVTGHYRPWVPLFPTVNLTFHASAARTILRNVPLD